jgi:hypothetical protein
MGGLGVELKAERTALTVRRGGMTLEFVDVKDDERDWPGRLSGEVIEEDDVDLYGSEE